MTELPPERALAAVCQELSLRGRRFALVGGLAVSVRAEVRFTRDVDLVVLADDDSEAESLIYALRSVGYVPVASVENEKHHRLSSHLARITERGYARNQDLDAKLDSVLRDIGRAG
jgi:hypothetical protein